MSHRKFITVAISALFILTLFHSKVVFAQDANGSASADGQASGLSGTRKQIAIIIFSGLAGGILGLSTLSFYGRPQDHLSNIALGFAVGIISGTIYTSYKAATRPYETFDTNSASTGDLWYQSVPFNGDVSMAKSRAQLESNSVELPLFSYGWTFN